MKIRLADYVADLLVKNGISHCFTVTTAMMRPAS